MSYRIRNYKAAAAVASAAFFAAAPGLARAHYAPGDPVGLRAHSDPLSAALNRIDELGPKYVHVKRHHGRV